MDAQISLNDQWKPFAEHLLQEYEWSKDQADHAMQILEEYLLLFPSKDSIPIFIKNLIEAVSLTAAPMMALQNFDRYLCGLKFPAKELMRCAQDQEHFNFITSLFATSTFFTDVLAGKPEFLDWIMKNGRIHREKKLEEYVSELWAYTENETDFEKRRTLLCEYKRREYLRIGIRDLLERGRIKEYCHELTNLAEAVCQFAYEEAAEQTVKQYGMPRPEGAPDDHEGELSFCIIAMGKFGGQELNFSSDIDLNFVYKEEGQTTGILTSTGMKHNSVTNLEFYSQLAFAISNYINEPTEQGMIFRVDTRLRPEGSAGTIARSYTSCSSFFFTQALMWEKVAYVKARVVTGDQQLATRFHKLVHSFVFTNNDADILLPEVARLKKRIDFERLSAEGRQLDIKRGQGGIREIEFITACFQLILGGKYEQLRTRSTIKALDIIAELEHLKKDESEFLKEAYWFFRRVEHQIQMVDEKQTHELPDTDEEMQRLAVRLGFRERDSLMSVLDSYRKRVRNLFETVFRMDQSEQKMELIDVVENREAPDHLAFELLKPYRMDSSEGIRALRELALGTREMAVLAKGQQAFRELLPILMGELKTAADPINAIKHLSHLLKAHRSISAFYQLIIAHPAVMRLLIRSLGFSPMVARLLAAHPEWLDEVFEGDVLDMDRADPQFTMRDTDTEEQKLSKLRDFRNKETIHLAIREVIGMEKSFDAASKTTRLADHCLSQVMDLYIREELRPHLAIVGMGTMGGMKVHPFGDLDIGFITDRDNLSYEERSELERGAQKVLKRMSEHSPQGQLWKVDSRLRPDGVSSPLVTDLQRADSYYRDSADFWEFQSATKLRPCCGNLVFGQQLIEIIKTNFSEKQAGYDIKDEIFTMRKRMEASHKVPRHAASNLKSCPGGIIDINFLVQYFILDNFSTHPELWQPCTTESLKSIKEMGLLDENDAEFLIDHHYHLRLIQRAIRFHMETSKDLLPAKQPILDALAVAMAAQTNEPVKLLNNIQRDMDKMRELFEKVLK